MDIVEEERTKQEFLADTDLESNDKLINDKASYTLMVFDSIIKIYIIKYRKSEDIVVIDCGNNDNLLIKSLYYLIKTTNVHNPRIHLLSKVSSGDEKLANELVYSDLLMKFLNFPEKDKLEVDARIEKLKDIAQEEKIKRQQQIDISREERQKRHQESILETAPFSFGGRKRTRKSKRHARKKTMRRKRRSTRKSK